MSIKSFIITTFISILHNITKEQTQYWSKFRKLIRRLADIQDYSSKNYEILKDLNRQVKDLIEKFPYDSDHSNT